MEATVTGPLLMWARNDDADKKKEVPESSKPKKKARRDNEELRDTNEGEGSSWTP